MQACAGYLDLQFTHLCSRQNIDYILTYKLDCKLLCSNWLFWELSPGLRKIFGCAADSLMQSPNILLQWVVLGVEPRTFRTRRDHHTTRPNSQMNIIILKTLKGTVSEFLHNRSTVSSLCANVATTAAMFQQENC